MHGELTDAEMGSLYSVEKIKAHVNFTHGEGFGRPLLEASLSGKPVIASNWSGHIDFLDKDLAILIDGKLQPVSPESVNDWIIKESQWFTVSYSQAASKMIDVYENYDKYLPNAVKLAKLNSKKFSLEAMDREMEILLDKHIPKFAKKTQIILPKLKKVGDTNLPQIKLPQLKKKE